MSWLQAICTERTRRCRYQSLPSPMLSGKTSSSWVIGTECTRRVCYQSLLSLVPSGKKSSSSVIGTECTRRGSYNNRNPALGVLWSWHRVASPPIEIPIQIWKKKFADKLHKSYKKHPWQTSPTFSGHFTLQAEPKINWNNYISMVLWACFPTKSAFTKIQTTKMAVVMITRPMRSR